MVEFALLAFFGAFLFSIVSTIKPLRPFRRRSRALIAAILAFGILMVLAAQAENDRIEALKVEEPAAYAKLMAEREEERQAADKTRKAQQAAANAEREAERAAAEKEKLRDEAAAAELKAAQLAAINEEAAIQECKERFQSCRSQKALFEHFGGITAAMTTCRRATMKSARYGEPDLPWLAFNAYFPIENSFETGEISLVERNATIPNAFGGKIRVTIKCVYDLREQRVREIIASSD